MNGSGGKSRRLSEGERILWREITRSIAPLRSQPADETEQAAEAKRRPQEVSSPPRAAKPQPARPKVETPPAPAPAPLGRRLKLLVAQGREAIDGRLDLHGLTQAEAHDALLRFLHTAQARGARLVMVITGKGRGEGGVLKRQVPLWLALPEFRGKVIGFEQAHHRHGGEGALYLRVRKGR
jgi:DNA-nicking Smr family endonuclease